MIINRRPTEMARILALPRIPNDTQYPDLTPQLRRLGGTMRLRDVQNKGLHIAQANKGGGFLISVGGGKGLFSLLLPVYLNIPVAVLLIPANMRKDLEDQRRKFTPHFKMPRKGQLHVMSFAQLSSERNFDFLMRLKPDAIIADEADKLANLKKSARARRVNDYFRMRPETMFFFMTGTIANDSIMNFAHLFKWALGDRSPVPVRHNDQVEWAGVLDHSMIPPTDEKIAVLDPLVDEFGERTGDAQRDARLAFRQRLKTAPGVLVTDTSSWDGTVLMEQRRTTVPQQIKDALKMLHEAWTLPNGDTVDTAPEKSEQANRLGYGFYYIWVWPNCPNCKRVGCELCSYTGQIVDTDWLTARKMWGRGSDKYLTYNSSPGVDSEKLLSNLCQQWFDYYQNGQKREEKPDVKIPKPLLEAWVAWQAQKHKPKPPTKTVWLSDFALQDTVFAARSLSESCIIWYSYDAIGEALAYLLPEAVHLGTGPKANAMLVKLNNSKNPPTIIASVAAHGRGKNCQSWRENIVTVPMPNGRRWQQLIGRCARQNQLSQWVRFTYNASTAQYRKNMRVAKSKARMLEDTGSGVQRLNSAIYR